MSAMFISHPADADTFGGQFHVLRSRGQLDGLKLEPCGTCQEGTLLPEHVVLIGDGDLAGGDFRFDFMFGRFRAGAGLGVLAVRDIDVEQGGISPMEIDDGIVWHVETFGGFEFLRGPVYLYADLRAVAGMLSVPVKLTSLEAPAMRYRSSRAGFGPRLGMLLPIGHSAMIDFAVYQRVVGGLEQTTGFIGFAYWENDRRDPFSDDLGGGFWGDF